MQDIDDIRKLHRVDGAVRVAIKILYHFQNTRALEALQRFGMVMLRATLRQVQGITDGTAHRDRQVH